MKIWKIGADWQLHAIALFSWPWFSNFAPALGIPDFGSLAPFYFGHPFFGPAQADLAELGAREAGPHDEQFVILQQFDPHMDSLE